MHVADVSVPWTRILPSDLPDVTNKSSIEAIECSQFILCLDDQGIRPSTGSTKRRDFRRESIIRGNKHDHTPRCFNLLTGGGSELYTSNRWCDKFMQFVIGRDGTCGLLIEHSGSEGITLIRFLQQFLQFLSDSGETGAGGENSIYPNLRSEELPSSKSPIQHHHVRVDSSKRTSAISAEMISRLRGKQVIQLKFDLDDVSLKGIQEAGKRVDKLIQDLDLFLLPFKTFGKEFIKSQFMSPDAFIQLSLQLTHYKVHRRLVSSYESAGTRQFREGRVDNIRSCTSEALNWARAMCDELPDVSVSTLFLFADCMSSNMDYFVLQEQQKVQLFQSAMAKQIEILKYVSFTEQRNMRVENFLFLQTISGHGPENHLLGLREMAKKRGDEVPLFKEKAYKEYLNFRLSTSQLPSQEDIVIGYGNRHSAPGIDTKSNQRKQNSHFITGPVVPDGYGCSYNPCRDQINFSIGSFYSATETSSDFFARSLEGSLLQMREICYKIKDQSGQDVKS